jgi:competence protein ComEC
VRVDPVLVAACAAVLGGCAASSPLATGAATFGIALLLGTRLSRRAMVAALVVLVVASVRAVVAPQRFESALVTARKALGSPSRCVGVGRVTRSPAARSGVLGFVARFETLDCEGRMLRDVSARLYGGPPELARGDEAEIVADLAAVEMFKNADLPDPIFPAARAGVVVSGGVQAVRPIRPSHALPAWIDRARAHVRRRIDATFANEAAPLARALVLGENDLTDGDAAAFRASGLAHLLAVSGTHLVFAILGVVRSLSFLFARIEVLAAKRDVGRYAAAIGVVMAPLYADFAGGSGSAWRAAWMLMVGLAARALGRRPSPDRSFALSLATGAIVDPLVAFDVSFLLSAAATSGLLAFGAPLAKALAPKGAPRWRRFVAAPAIATVAATLPCAPLLATLGPRLTLAGLVANVVAAPFGEVVSLPLCLLHAISILAPLERGIAVVASGALLVVRAIAHASAAATWLTVLVPPPSAWHFAILGVGAVGALLSRSSRFVWVFCTALALGLVEMAAFRAGHPHGVLRVTVLDVGQGDSTLLDLPDGELVLVDGGGMVGSPVDPGVAVLLPVLRARRRDRIDIAILSHPHPDHFIGLASTVRDVEVGEFWDTGQGRVQGAGATFAGLMETLSARRIAIVGPASLCGSRWKGGVLVEVVAPCPAFDPALGANDNSFVVRLRHGNRRVLLTGDSERVAEQKLLERADLVADFLKVGHHGSRTSTSRELIERVRPALATISSGVRNRFGHPHPATLATLVASGVTVFRTDTVGSIEWSDEEPGMVRSFGASFRERFAERLW